MGLSVKGLARISGVSDTTIRNFEKGKNRLRIDSCCRVAKALGVSPIIFCSLENDNSRGPIAERIQKLRLLLGMKQDEFAQFLGVDPSSVRDWELGALKKRKPSKKNYSLIMELLETCESCF